MASTGARPARRELALVLVLVLPLAAVLLALPPIRQDPAYHAFADTRTFFGVPNFWNVASNVPFAVVAITGLALCSGGRVRGAVRSWAVFFGGTALVALGSGYYHWMPDSATLVWDRIPMTIAFMGLLTALVSEHLDARIQNRLLAVSLPVGIASVVWWHYTDDLRLYAWVQFGPLLAIAFMVATFPGRYSHRVYLAYGLGFYVVAKIAEFTDGVIYSATGGTISGHVLKHLLAAGAPLCVYLMLKRRSAIAR